MKIKTKYDSGLFIAVILLAIGFLMLFFPYFKLNNLRALEFKIVIPEYDKLASFISGVTAPFLSLAAFLLLYLTYKSQKIELNESRQILISQNVTQNLQRFETTFFNILNLHDTIVNNIQVVITTSHTDIWKGTHWNEKEKITGRDCFRELFFNFKDFYMKKLSESDEDELMIIKIASLNFYTNYSSKVAHYFNNLYNLMKFIEESEIEAKQLYVNLLCAQLSSYELLLLFYYGLSDQEPNLAPYIVNFHVFRAFPYALVFNVDHLKLYDKAAYSPKQATYTV